jgi:hypothetical protein
MNYHYADWIYRKNKMEDNRGDDYFQQVGRTITEACRRSGISCEVVY